MTQSTTDSDGTEPPARQLPSPKERRRLREARSLSEEQVAEAIGVTRATIRSWETGRTTPRGRKREAYVKFLGSLAADGEARNAAGSTEGGNAACATAGAAEGGTGARSRRGGDTARTDGSGRARRAPTAGATKSPAPAITSTSPRAVAAKRAPESSHGTGEPRASSSAAESPAAEESAPATGLGGPAAGPSAAGSPAAPPPPPAPPSPALSRHHRAPTAHFVLAVPQAREPGLTPEQAFDDLYTRTAPDLVRQAYLLTGRRGLALEAVEHAFHLAWQRWPEVAVDRYPEGWVRAAVYEYALSPWHRLRRSHRRPEPAEQVPVPASADPERRTLRKALLELPPPYRRTMLLYDGLGLDLPETAAETEASTPAAANRILHARELVAEQLPELAEPETLHEELSDLVRAVAEPEIPPAPAVRDSSERRTQFWTRAAFGLTALIIGATALTLATTQTHYDPPQAPGEAVSGVPPRGGPPSFTKAEVTLRTKLRSHPNAGPERLVPRVG